MRERTWLRWRHDGKGGAGRLWLVRWLVVASVAVGMAAVGSLGGAHLAHAAPATCASGWTTTVNGTTTTCSLTFGSTGAEQSFTVPTGVGALTVKAVGGNGGGSYYRTGSTVSGGVGAEVDAIIPTSALPLGTSTLYVEVGGNGANGSYTSGGWNGGGQGFLTGGIGNSGGGGGASDVRAGSCGTSCGTPADTTLGTRLLVAAGGGGAGMSSDCNAIGGTGGSGAASTGSAGAAGSSADCVASGSSGGLGGGGGTPTSGGSGGSGGTFVTDSGATYQGSAGGSGVLGIGGDGGFGAGGGGGGGYYGGGGGGNFIKYSSIYIGASGGGGAGSNFVTSSALNASVGPGAGGPSVTVSYSLLTVTTTTTTLAASANPVMVGQPVTFTATVSPAPDAGSVNFSQNGVQIVCGPGSQPLTNGTASCALTESAVGSYAITASYSGDSTYTSSSASLTLSVDTNISQYLQNGVYNLSNVNLSGAYLAGANLSGASLSDGNFSGATFTGANLSGANLSNGNFSGATFTGANLSGANVTQTNLIGATGLASATLTGVIWNKTTCPDNTLSSKDGGTCLGHL